MNFLISIAIIFGLILWYIVGRAAIFGLMYWETVYYKLSRNKSISYRKFLFENIEESLISLFWPFLLIGIVLAIIIYNVFSVFPKFLIKQFAKIPIKFPKIKTKLEFLDKTFFKI